MAEDVLALRELERAAVCGGGQARQRRQQRLGRMLARDRIAALVDSDSFVEHGMLVRGTGGAAAREKPAWGDGVVTGLGRVGGRPVAIYAHDATVLRGALGSAGAQKIVSILGLAREHGIPVVAIHDSDGVRVGEGAPALAGFARVLGETARLSGWVPQIGVVLGLCVGGSAYSSALHDVVIGCSGQGFLFVTGAKVTQVVTREQTPIDELGGVEMHAARTGLVHLRHESEAECLGLARSVLSYLPQNARQAPPQASPDDPVDRPTNALEKLIPEDPRWAYDMRRVVTEIFDRDSVLELQPGYAGSIIVALARLGGRAVGVVASQPMVNAGALDCDSSRKAARFIQMCNSFGLPIITLADVPGFLPGRAQEQGGLLLHGAKLIAAYAACTVPLISLIVRKSYGGGNVLAYPGHIRLAYPYARAQAMGIDAAMAVARHASFGALSDVELAALKKSLSAAYDGVHHAAAAGFVDRLIYPDRTRAELSRALESLATRLEMTGLPPRKLANIPL